MGKKVMLKAAKDFKQQLKNAKALKGVETEVIAPAYRRVISEYFEGGSWDFDSSTDGFFLQDDIFGSIRLLLETKFDFDLRLTSDRAKIVIQCIYYMKKYEQSGHPQPNVIFGADADQMFVIYAPPLRKYLEMDFDWALSPSEAWRGNSDLLNKIGQEELLQTFVFDAQDKSFDVNDVLHSVEVLSNNNGNFERIKIVPQTLRIVFEEFLRALDLSHLVEKKSLTYSEVVHIFISSIIGSRDVYIDTKYKNRFHVGDKHVTLDTSAYVAFFSRYEKNYTPAEISLINSMYDTLFEETERRFSGDYWTPTLWADRAHELLDSKLGSDWKSEYLVWDAACGTKNLTRDYEFENLYLSTLFDHELSTSKMYNSSATSFQFDFLNDDIELKPNALFGQEIKIPPKLYQDLVNDRPIVFFMNPPYGTASLDGKQDKANIAKTAMNSFMKRHKLDKASQQLYAQFFFRVLKLKQDFNLSNVVIAFFTNDRFLSGGDTWDNFLQKLQKDFQYEGGFMFNAGEFSDVSARWAISFTVWKTTKNPIEKQSFELSVEESTSNGIKKLGIKESKAVKQVEFLSEWVREPLKGEKDFFKSAEFLPLSNALTVNTSKSGNRASLLRKAIGYAHNNGNNIGDSGKYVEIYSGARGSGNGFSVIPAGIDRAVVNFTIRKCVDSTWINSHDNFLRPPSSLLERPEWEVFVNDSLIYSIASRSGSNQSALRGVVNQFGNRVDLNNEWFFSSRARVQDLAQAGSVLGVLEDLRKFPGERLVHQEILRRTLSLEASRLLASLDKLLEETMPLRQQEEYENPDGSFLAWDAGFWQLYLIASKHKLPSVGVYLEAFKDMRAACQARVLQWGLV